MKQVTITKREVYHKVASVTIEVPSNISQDKIHDWILNTHELFFNELDDALSEARFEYGFGLGDGMDCVDCESETRFDLIEDSKKVFGGHL
jgi:hypothetical protein